MNDCLCYLLIVYYQILHKLSTLFLYISYIFLLILCIFHKLYIQQYIVCEVQTFAQIIKKLPHKTVFPLHIASVHIYVCCIRWEPALTRQLQIFSVFCNN